MRAFVGWPGVAQEGTGFGSSARKVHGCIFAMLSSWDQFVVKLPRRRVDALVASGDGERYDPGHGRVMKEGLAVWPTSSLQWEALVRNPAEPVHRIRPCASRTGRTPSWEAASGGLCGAAGGSIGSGVGRV